MDYEAERKLPEYNRSQVKKIVDSCFHAFASHARADAQKMAKDIMDLFDKEELKNGL